MFSVNIETDNAAFENDAKFVELARLLRKIADDVENGRENGRIRDLNGNFCGTFNLD